jgi:hypothetical protein
MVRERPFQTAICAEYEALLHKCKSALDELQRKEENATQNNAGATEQDEVLVRLREYYERLFARLVDHYERCEVCQFSQRSGGKTPPRHSRAVRVRKRSA